MVQIAQPQPVFLQQPVRALTRPAAHHQAHARLAEPARRPPAARPLAAAAGRQAHRRRRVQAAAAARAMEQVTGFKLAVFSAQPFVEDFMREPLEAAFPADSIKVRPPRALRRLQLYRTCRTCRRRCRRRRRPAAAVAARG